MFNKKRKKQRKIDHTFLKMCIEFANLSKCVSHQVACLIVKENRIISSGINGTATGYVNCDEKFNKKKYDRVVHHNFSNKYEIHAEMNSILNAAKNGISIKDSTAYCTLEPCLECSKNFSMSGIKRIVYLNSYDMYPKTERKERDKYLKKVKITIERF